MLTAIPYGMWQNTSHTQQYSDTIRSRRLLDSATKDDSNSSGQHCGETITYLQAQGSVERFHRTLLGQVRALKLQLENNYIHLTSTHPIMPWMIKHAAYLLNRYAVHANRNTSYYRPWNKERKTPSVSLEKQFLTCYQQQNTCPKWKQDFVQPLAGHRHIHK